ncbi:MAG: hypothetical protein IJ252_08730 [Solobacterium sp.]|nr:hypothetical protein [Solobacterium sp.]
MNTNIRKNLFKYMIILHLASMILYIPATGAGYRHNILYDILCTAVIALELVVCRKDERHEKFWLFYIVVHFLAIASIHMSAFSKYYYGGAWDLIVLFLTAPVVYICFSRVRSNALLLVIEAVSVIVLGYLLFITVRRLRKKKSNKQEQTSSDPAREPSD